MEVLGFGRKVYEFADKRTGEMIHTEGYIISLADRQKGFEGIFAQSYYFNDAKLSNYKPKVGDNVRIGFNRYGKPDFIVLE